jgi:hypothetical protein
MRLVPGQAQPQPHATYMVEQLHAARGPTVTDLMSKQAPVAPIRLPGERTIRSVCAQACEEPLGCVYTHACVCVCMMGWQEAARHGRHTHAARAHTHTDTHRHTRTHARTPTGRQTYMQTHARARAHTWTMGVKGLCAGARAHVCGTEEKGQGEEGAEQLAELRGLIPPLPNAGKSSVTKPPD